MAAILLVAVAGAGAAARAAGGFLPLVAASAGAVLGLLPHPAAAAAGVKAQEPVSILVLGTEAAPGYAGPQLTDSMMVMSLDPSSHTAAMLSVPRDLWLNIPGFGYQRINTAMENVGIAGAELTVEQYVGVPIEYYALVNYAALVQLVNDVGGINVNVPYAINDSCYPNVAENKCTTFVLSAGPHHLDGATALQFARERHSFADGDIQRQRDQQLVLYALKNALLQPQNLTKLPKIIGDMEHLVQTNLPYSDIPTLALQALQLPKSSIHSAVFDYSNDAVTNYTTPGGADVLLLHQQPAAQIVRQNFTPLLAQMETASVQVEDGTPGQRAGAYFTGVLQGMGVPTLPPVAAAQSSLKGNQVVVNRAVLTAAGGSNVPVEATILAQMLGTTVQTARVPGSRADIVVQLGSAFPSV